MKRHQPILLVFLGIISLSLCSCAMLDSDTKKSGTLESSETAEIFYVGLEGLKLFSEPRFSKTSIANLPLHEKVVRDKLEKGFAHVTVIRTGQTGWVNNAHLLWKVPSPSKSLPTEPPPSTKAPDLEPSTPPKVSDPETAPSPQAPDPEPAPQKMPAKENVIQEPEYPDTEREGRDAAIFNRF